MVLPSPARILALAISGITLVACGYDDPAKPGDRLTLTFTGKSNSEYFFALENPTSDAIHFRVFKSLWIAPAPVDMSFDCKNEKSGEGTVGGFPLFDGGKDPPIIEVAPGKAIKLRLKVSDTGSELAKHKGEACRSQLLLWQPNMPRQRGTLVESQEFQPSLSRFCLRFAGYWQEGVTGLDVGP
jgi:hypothetical protein